MPGQADAGEWRWVIENKGCSAHRRNVRAKAFHHGSPKLFRAITRQTNKLLSSGQGIAGTGQDNMELEQARNLQNEESRFKIVCELNFYASMLGRLLGEHHE